MRLTVHRVEVALYHGDRLQHVWWEHSFKPSERVIIDRDDCVNVVWSTSKPVEVEAPALCRLADVDLPRNPKFPPAIPPARQRLVTPFDAMGWDATTVYHAASKGLRGFRLAGAESTCQTPPKIFTDVCTTSDHRWGIAFASRQLPHHRTFLRSSSVTPTGAIASTRSLAEVATWATRDEAAGWMLGAGLDPANPVPVGIGWLYPAVAEVPAEIAGAGVEFELPRAGAPVAEPEPVRPAPAVVEPPWVGPETQVFEEPVAAKPRRNRELVGQMMFEF